MKRRDAIAAVTAAGMAVAAGLWRFTDVIVKHYPPTPYDDLLNRLTDREQAIKLGARLQGDFDVTHQAARLRATLANQDLGAAVNADIGAGRMIEVAGWVVPETLALLAALAAKV
jgi:hypothetical protein